MWAGLIPEYVDNQDRDVIQYKQPVTKRPLTFSGKRIRQPLLHFMPTVVARRVLTCLPASTIMQVFPGLFFKKEEFITLT